MKNRLHGIHILYEDQDVIVLEKDAGILSQDTRDGNTRSVETALTDYVRKGQAKSSKHIYLVHRLDRETCGVMMVAKNETAQQWLRDNWNEVTEKIYRARVDGIIDNNGGVYQSFLQEDDNYFVHSTDNPELGKLACTVWRVLERDPQNNTTLVEIKLKSGRKNQIRVHFAEANHPVIGDSKYGHAQRGETLCLQACKLSFVHPYTQKRMTFETPKIIPQLCEQMC